MIKLTCKCNKSFEIDEANIINKTKIVCQNCNTELPQNVLSAIVTYVNSKQETEKYFQQINKEIYNDTEEPKEFWTNTNWKVEF